MTESAGHPAGTVQQITGSGARWRGWGCSQRRGLQHRDGASPAHPLPSCVAETALPVSGNPILQHLGSSPSTSEAFPQQLCQRRLCPHSSRALKCPLFSTCAGPTSPVGSPHSLFLSARGLGHAVLLLTISCSRSCSHFNMTMSRQVEQSFCKEESRTGLVPGPRASQNEATPGGQAPCALLGQVWGG